MQVPRWKLLLSIALTAAVVVLIYINRNHIWQDLLLLRNAQPLWLLAAVAMLFVSFFVGAQVYYRTFRSLGYHFGRLHLTAVALVAIVLSQSFPAGGVASYAFLVQSFRRRGVPSGHSTLAASMEILSYVGGMVIMFVFSVLYLAITSGSTASAEGGLLAAGVAMLVIGVILFVLTRDIDMLTRQALALKNGVARVLRRQIGDTSVLKLADDVSRGRALLATRRREVIILIGIQILALIGHSSVMLLVLMSLGVPVSLVMVMTAYGVALLTSTFNVLPGGGGTVEAALALTLSQMGLGGEAVVGAVIFRLLNYWLMTPIAAICYRWLMHGKVRQDIPYNQVETL